MSSRKSFFTSESVTEGHPDKVADQISDAVLDAIMTDDPFGRVAVETLVTTGSAIVAGEVTTSTYVPISKVVRQVIEEIGYTRAKYGFDSETVGVFTAIQEQSPDIWQGVQVGGAGDQGMMFGYATNETPELMPMPIMLAHKLAKRMADVRTFGELPYLRPDGKTQVTVEYDGDTPVGVTKVLLAAQHAPGVGQDEIKADLIEKVVEPVIPSSLRRPDMVVMVNRTGIFTVGGPQADTGLTGRKIIVDTYGGWAVHGGGAFSGKDPTKVDRSAGYMARYVAKNIVAAGLAKECLVQLGYCIGLVDPVSVMVNTYGTGKLSDEALSKLVRQVFPLSPGGIIDHLDLRKPVYRKTAAYGHFGRKEFAWERVDATEELVARAKNT